MNAEKGSAENNIWQNPLLRKVAIYGTVLLAVFLIGFVPMWLTARSRANDLAAVQVQLKAAKLQNLLASSVINARRGEYEPARKSASDFFTSLRSELELENNSALSQAQRDSVKPLLSQRDEIITLLSRSDPASADRLSDFYVLYRKVFEGT
ncbi:MAG: hypothetical protein IPK01_17200 [Acidobacteria bacterium]|nr:hypothetical protein [Acidobacteriota bacterium]